MWRLNNFLAKLKAKLSGAKVSLRAKLVGINITLGADNQIPTEATLSTEFGGKIILGKNVKIRPYVQLLTYGGDIVIGDNVLINQFSVIYGHGGTRIGNDVQIAPHTVIISANHNIDNTDIPIKDQGETRKGIVIGNDVWIGANVSILDGVKIGNGCVIGAGTVVTKSVDDYAVVAGNPGRVIKSRKHE